MNRIVRRRGVDRPMGEIKATSARYGNIGKIIVHKKHRFQPSPTTELTNFEYWFHNKTTLQGIAREPKYIQCQIIEIGKL